MVRISRPKPVSQGHSALLALLALMAVVLAVIAWLLYDAAANPYRTPLPEDNGALVTDKSHPGAGVVAAVPAATCPYTSLQQLTPEERFPHKGPRHQVEPPQGGLVTLVCCQTTAGPWSIAVHGRWAPRGSQRFLKMVRAGYFNNPHRVPLMRCVRNFLCQFGLAGPTTTALSKEFDRRMPDDPNWLPIGPDYKVNADGVKRFARGYFAYAGSGVDSRGVQLIVSLQDNPRLGGGSPWEVPWGELVGAHSFETLSKIYTGYGEQGPSQGRLRREGASAAVARDFPLLDYITSCQVVDEAKDEAPKSDIVAVAN